MRVLNYQDRVLTVLDAYLAALKPDGFVSVSVSIRDFPVYSLRVLATARQALAGFLDGHLNQIKRHT